MGARYVFADVEPDTLLINFDKAKRDINKGMPLRWELVG